MSENDELYRELIDYHAHERHGCGLREDAAAESHQINPTCGDEVTLRVHLGPAGRRVDSLSWDGVGCEISQASVSMLHDLIGGQTTQDARALIAAFREVIRSRGALAGDPEVLGDAVALGGVARYPARVKCAMLGWVAFEDALDRAGGQ